MSVTDLTDTALSDAEEIIRNAQLRVVEHQADDPWEPPTRIAVDQLPDFPVHALPGWVGRHVEQVAEARQVASDMPGTAALSVLAAACGGHVNFRIRDDWVQPANLYIATAAASGENKSATYAQMVAPLRELEKEEIEAMRSEISEAEVRKRIAEKAAEQAEKSAANKTTGEARGIATDEAVTARFAADAIEVPPSPRRIIEDVTPEVLLGLLAKYRALFLASSEGVVFHNIGRYDNKISGPSPGLPALLKPYDGEDIDVDRKGSGTLTIREPSLNILVFTQPEVLVALAKKPGAMSTGLIPRFLFSMPRSSVGSRDMTPAPTSEVVTLNYTTQVKNLARGLRQTGTSVPVVRFTTEARDALTDYMGLIEKKMLDELADMHPWANKLRAQVARIAGILHMADHGLTGLDHEVSAQVMQRAIELGDYFLAHALAVFDLMGEAPALANARHALDRITKKRLEVVTPRDVLTVCSRARVGTAAAADEVIATLCEYGWLRMVSPPVPRIGGGHSTPARYAVYPGSAS